MIWVAFWHSIASAGHRVIQFFVYHARRWPVLWVTTTLCLLIGENYPFSNYPMYATFSDATYMVYITDQDGKPIPVFDTFGMRTSILKKIYHKEALKALRRNRRRMQQLEAEHLAEAGHVALVRLVSHRNDMAPHRYQALNLVHLNIVMEEGKIVRKPMTVATMTLASGGQP